MPQVVVQGGLERGEQLEDELLRTHVTAYNYDEALHFIPHYLFWVIELQHERAYKPFQIQPGDYFVVRVDLLGLYHQLDGLDCRENYFDILVGVFEQVLLDELNEARRVVEELGEVCLVLWLL